LTKKECFRRLR